MNVGWDIGISMVWGILGVGIEKGIPVFWVKF